MWTTCGRGSLRRRRRRRRKPRPFCGTFITAYEVEIIMKEREGDEGEKKERDDERRKRPPFRDVVDVDIKD